MRERWTGREWAAAPGPWKLLEAGVGDRWTRSGSHRVRPWLHSPPVPPWSPLAALAKPRPKDLRGKAMSVREAGDNGTVLSFSFTETSVPLPSVPANHLLSL